MKHPFERCAFRERRHAVAREHQAALRHQNRCGHVHALLSAVQNAGHRPSSFGALAHLELEVPSAALVPRKCGQVIRLRVFSQVAPPGVHCPRHDRPGQRVRDQVRRRDVVIAGRRAIAVILHAAAQGREDFAVLRQGQLRDFVQLQSKGLEARPIPVRLAVTRAEPEDKGACAQAGGNLHHVHNLSLGRPRVGGPRSLRAQLGNACDLLLPGRRPWRRLRDHHGRTPSKRRTFWVFVLEALEPVNRIAIATVQD